MTVEEDFMSKNSVIIAIALVTIFSSLKCIAMECEAKDNKVSACEDMTVIFDSRSNQLIVCYGPDEDINTPCEYIEFDDDGKKFLVDESSTITSFTFDNYDEEIMKILPALTSLTSLACQCVKPDSLIGLTRLRVLKIEVSFPRQPYSFDEVDVSTLTSLTALEVNGIERLAKLFSALAKNSNLKSLTIGKSRHRENEIAKLTSLTELHVPSLAVCGNSLRKLTKLTALNLDDAMEVTADHLDHLTAVRKLRVGHVVSDEERILLQLPQLIDLTIAQPTEINDADLEKLTNLKRLDLRELGPIDENGDITASGIKKLVWIEELLWEERR